jgi:uncharacterized radical SAM protein YgiQ
VTRVRRPNHDANLRARFLPASSTDLTHRGWEQPDILFITGDPYVDHPSFPASLLGRVLEAAGYRVLVLSRPDPGKPEELASCGPPRLFTAVTSGALDSMVANYTALRKKRSDDSFAPGGKGGQRPDRALTAYCNLIRRAFGKATPIVAGGLEASLRRFSHYDYWSNSIRRPLLMDCGADVLVYGMGEQTILAVAQACADNEFHEAVKRLPGVVWREPKSLPAQGDHLTLPGHEEVVAQPERLADQQRLVESNWGRSFSQDCSGMRIVANPPAQPLSTEGLDSYYALPFTRSPHPMYGATAIPALEQVRFSVTSHRGCAGGCSFCSISAHQGRMITSRSPQAVCRELEGIVAHPDFRGTVPDLGGPTANMYGFHCTRSSPCSRPSCLHPDRCRHLAGDQSGYLALLETARRIPGIKHLFVTTGIRMDLALKEPAFIKALAFQYTSGHLKIAPEHIVPEVLMKMRKPADNHFESFLRLHRKLSREAARKQYVLPYLMAAHPGCRLEDMVELALFMKKHRIIVEQCQIFTPTPGTTATAMYATGIDPFSGDKVFVEKDPHRKRLQKALILYHLPEQRRLVNEALRLAGRSGALA